MIRDEFWEKVADAWSKKEIIEIPSIEDELNIPEELTGNDSNEAIDFDDWNDEDMDDMDDFFSDILNDE